MRFGLLLTVLAVTAVSCLMAETRVGMRGRDSTTDGCRPAVSQLVSRRTVRDAGRIFSGSVMSVERAKASGAVTTTQITFRVEEAIRGVRRGQTLTISEWSVLWESGERVAAGSQEMWQWWGRRVREVAVCSLRRNTWGREVFLRECSGQC